MKVVNLISSFTPVLSPCPPAGTREREGVGRRRIPGGSYEK